MRTIRAVVSGVGLMGCACVGVLVLSSCGSSAGTTASADNSGPPHVVGNSKEEIGKYLVAAAGCNDCHTPGVMQGKTPAESELLTGVPVGFRGPWGTSYAANLRRKLKPYGTEEMFVKAMKLRNERPPMPWSALHAMTDADLGAVYCYVKSLPESGIDMPEPVPLGVEPKGPYINMEPVGVGTAAPWGGPGGK